MIRVEEIKEPLDVYNYMKYRIEGYEKDVSQGYSPDIAAQSLHVLSIIAPKVLKLCESGIQDNEKFRRILTYILNVYVILKEGRQWIPLSTYPTSFHQIYKRLGEIMVQIERISGISDIFTVGEEIYGVNIASPDFEL